MKSLRNKDIFRKIGDWIEYIIWKHIGIGDIGYIVDTLDSRAPTRYWIGVFLKNGSLETKMVQVPLKMLRGLISSSWNISIVLDQSKEDEMIYYKNECTYHKWKCFLEDICGKIITYFGDFLRLKHVSNQSWNSTIFRLLWITNSTFTRDKKFQK